MTTGTPTTLIENAQAPLFLGVDVGGTSIKYGLVDNLGRTLASGWLATEEEKGPQDGMRRVADAARQMAARLGVDWGQIVWAGLATPGTMDLATGTLLQPHNLKHWWNFPIRGALQQACGGTPVAFANDANAAAFGEYWVGRGHAFRSIVLLTLGTGVGGGIIVDDLSIDGENSHGSECGHTIIDFNDNARLCGCGQVGHLEAYASANAVIRRTEEGLATSQSTSSIQARRDRGEKITPLLVAQEAERGDSFALRIVLDTAMYLGIGIVNMMHIIDPGAVILGGAMNFGGPNSALGQQFLERVREEVRRRAFPTLIGRTVIDFASLGADAGYIGAAGIARCAYQKK